jgi:hypothetical protein
MLQVKKPTICLNMIVKDESHIIENTLEKLCKQIQFDYWVICDTGSSDNTIEIITTFFKKLNIKGEIYKDEWQDFAHNRTLALNRAYNKTDLLLVFDADDELIGDFVLPNVVLFDEYHLKFGNEDSISYTRVLMINNRKKFEYQSVIHEFISAKEPNSKGTIIGGNYYVVSGRFGNRSKDPDKYLKDALILEAAHKKALETNNHLMHRYAFYCANSFRDCGRLEEAIKWYKITLMQEKQWVQEKYISCLYIYDCYSQLKQPEIGSFFLIKAFAYDNERVECLFPLIVHYCCDQMFQVAYNFYLNVKDYFENRYLNSELTSKLFVSIDKYNFLVPYYMILIADKVQDFNCVLKMYEIIFLKKHKIGNIFFIKNLLYNLQFFLKHITEKFPNFIKQANEYINFLYNNGINMNDFTFFKEKEEYKNAGINIDYLFNIEIVPVDRPDCFYKKEECKNSKNILIYTGFSDIEWNDTYINENAFGGSEKAVVYISRCIPKNYNVYISGSVKREKIDNIEYIPLNELNTFLQKTPIHTLIISRYIAFYEMFKSCCFYQSYIWAHDTCFLPYGCNMTSEQIITKWNNYINGCICLTNWHKNDFIIKYPELKEKISIINNGLDKTYFKNKFTKIPYKFIYSSRPERGLEILIKLWEQIINQFPEAILVVCNYGELENKYKEEIDKFPSIIYKGKLKPDLLYKEMETSEYWLYPTNWLETSCITALEMLMSEVICIYNPIGGLIDTVGYYGMQIKEGTNLSELLTMNEEKKQVIRAKGRKYAESCIWSNRWKQWEQLLFK